MTAPKPTNQPTGLPLPGAIALCAISMGSALLLRDYLRDNPVVAAAHPAKAYGDPDAFYALYLEEHSHASNRLLHFVGTTIVLALAAFRYQTAALAALVAGSAGLAAFEVFKDTPNGIGEGAVFVAVLLLGSRLMAGSVRPALVIALVGYGFAWVGHFFVEENRPATFVYPTFSLISDFRMWLAIVSGQISVM